MASSFVVLWLCPTRPAQSFFLAMSNPIWQNNNHNKPSNLFHSRTYLLCLKSYYQRLCQGVFHSICREIPTKSIITCISRPEQISSPKSAQTEKASTYRLCRGQQRSSCHRYQCLDRIWCPNRCAHWCRSRSCRSPRSSVASTRIPWPSSPSRGSPRPFRRERWQSTRSSRIF